MTVRTGLVLAILLGLTGCAKMSAGATAPDYYEYEDYGGDDGYYGGVDADMAAPMEMEEASMGSGISSRRDARRERRAAKSAPMSPGAGGGGATMEPAPEPPADRVSNGNGAEPAVADDTPQDVQRHIIYTASMQVSVFNLQDAMTRAESLPAKYGGYVQNMSSNYFVMRIPAAKLRTVMDEISTLGVVDSRTLDAQDVTEEFLDIETRIAVLESTQKQMMELLTKARTVEEALEVRKALDEITMELEVLKGRLRRLDSLISYSTLTISLVERGPHNSTPSSNDPFPWVDSLGVEATEWK